MTFDEIDARYRAAVLSGSDEWDDPETENDDPDDEADEDAGTGEEDDTA